jgi:hypothetical protein
MRKKPPYKTGDQPLERLAKVFDRWAAALVQRVQRYVSRRWPRLGAWLSDD